jgi:hypothetical protein
MYWKMSPRSSCKGVFTDVPVDRISAFDIMKMAGEYNALMYMEGVNLQISRAL